MAAFATQDLPTLLRPSIYLNQPFVTSYSKINHVGYPYDLLSDLRQYGKAILAHFGLKVRDGESIGGRYSLAVSSTLGG